MQVSDQLLTVIDTIIKILTGSVAGVLVSQYLNSRAEKRRQKIVSIDMTDSDLSLPSIKGGHKNIAGEFNITFKRKSIKNPRVYTIYVQNLGYRAIDGMKLAITFPVIAIPLGTSISTVPLSLSCSLEKEMRGDKIERIFAVGRMEVGDRITMTFFLDTLDADEIECQPRGVDDLKPMITRSGYRKAGEYVGMITLTPRYKLVFTTITYLTIASLLGYIILAILQVNYLASSPLVDGVLSTLKTAFVTGFGAIVGLLAGKAI